MLGDLDLHVLLDGFCILAHQLQNLLLLKQCSQLFVLPDETYPKEPVPLEIVYLRRWVLWFYPYHTALDFRGRLEVVLGHLH